MLPSIGRRFVGPFVFFDHMLPVDNVVLAIGTTPNPLLTRTTPGLVIDAKGCLITNKETGRTTVPFVFAGGDAVTGAATVILAAGAGKSAAHAIAAALAD